MIVLLTALPTEYSAVYDHLINVQEHRHHAGTVFDVGTIESRPDRKIALAATGMGNLSSATLTERAVEEFSPTAMIFVGVAGGLRDGLALGDVIVATRIYAYHGGRSEDDEFLVRPRVWEMSHPAEQVAIRLDRAKDWHRLLPATGEAPNPKVHFGPIAAGDVVLNSRVSAQAQRIRRNYNDAVAVEMESAGFASAGHLNGRVQTSTIRAISDYADGNKYVTDRDGWQPIAARNAAAFAIALAAALDDEAVARPKTTVHTAPQIQSTSIARGNARVGQQIGTNLGSAVSNYYGDPRSTGDVQ